MHSSLKSLCAVAVVAASLFRPVSGAVTVVIRNPSQEAWAEAPVAVAVGAQGGMLPDGELAARAGGEILPVQRDDLNGDGKTDELAFLAKLGAGETKSYEIISRPVDLKVEKRAHALMSLKGFDGPAWESELTAYRIYWNADNAMDIFGKARPTLSLEGWATPGVPHNIENQYGLDVLKVGRALGMGGFAGWINGRIEKVSNVMKTHHIRATGPIRAVVDLEYVYWQPGPFPDLSRQAISSPQKPHYDLLARMSIFAGQKWGECQLTIRPYPGSPMLEVVAGLVKHEDTTLVKDEAAGTLGRWGNQALGDKDAPKSGNLGIGVVVDPKQVVTYGEDDFNSYVRLKPVNGQVTYRYHGSWFKEPGAAKSAEEYAAMLKAVGMLRPMVELRPAR